VLNNNTKQTPQHMCIIPEKYATDTLQTTPTHAYCSHKAQACIIQATQARHDKHQVVSVKCRPDIFLWNV
jgi:hypothetical protein